MSEAIAAKLDEARALIEKGWTQGWFARNAAGRKVSALPTGRTATCYCMGGAVMRVTGKDVYSVSQTPEYRALEAVVPGHYVEDWNDDPERTQAEVIEAFRKAAELARGGLVDPLEQVKL